MKKGQIPSDLDREAVKKWKELVETVDSEVDTELLGNYCRTYSGLMAIRSEKARQLKAGKYESLVPGRDGALQLNPLQTAENRMVSSLNRMLRTLGLAPSRDEQRRRVPAPDADAIDPFEAALCWPYGFRKIQIWREAPGEADKDERDRRLAAWKVTAGIVDDGDDGPVPAPGLNASAADWSAYGIAKQQQSERIEGAIRRAGLDPRKQ